MLTKASSLFLPMKERIFPSDPDVLMRREIRREANWFAETIRRKLTRLGLCYRYPKNQKDFLEKGVQEIKFFKATGSPDAVYLHINTMLLPRGVRLDDLAEEAVLNDLSVVCERPVRFIRNHTVGAMYLIERNSGVWGIPRLLPYGDVLDQFPESSGKPLLIPLGVGENRKQIFRSLAQFPHALIGGATGAGKTTFMHGWICSLILKNGPDDLRLALVDLKGGTEFTRYKKLPHLLTNEMMVTDLEAGGFVKRADDVVPLLAYMQKEMDGRLARFEKAGGIQNVRVWNYHHRKSKLPRLVLFVDELAVIMLDPTLKKHTKRLLADITARGRAPGVHVVLATQRPEVKVVDGLIKGNIDARFAFRVTDNASSMVILDTTEAARFNDSTPLGRFVYRSGLEKYEVQAPLITDKQISQYVKSVCEGRGEEDVKSVRIPPEEIFEFSVQQLGGNFSRRVLYSALDGQVSVDYLNRLGEDYEGEIIEVGGALYELQAAKGSMPRKLVRIEDGGGNGKITIPQTTNHNQK